VVGIGDLAGFQTLVDVSLRVYHIDSIAAEPYHSGNEKSEFTTRGDHVWHLRQS